MTRARAQRWRRRERGFVPGRRVRRGVALAIVGIVVALGTRSVTAAPAATRLDVPCVVQARERCGPAALEMVLRYYGAGDAAVREAGTAYDPALHGALITDLAAAARRAGYTASIATLTPDSLTAWLADGVPPIVLYQNGRGPITATHYGVVTGWDPVNGTFTLNDGGRRARVTSRDDLERRWRTAGGQALIVRRDMP